MKYVANVPHVREVSLLGTGPNGDSRLLIAADMRFLGVPFREVSLSILTGENEARLVQAWSSVRFFAWCERTFFSTPYAHGNVHVTTDPPSFSVEGVLRAEMRGDREPTFVGDDEWNGAVHLPNGRHFYARLSGVTRKYPFLTQDIVELEGFMGKEWIVRDDGTHAKSKTYRGVKTNWSRWVG